MTLKRAEELGTWDGDTFTFHEPVDIGGGRIMRQVRLPGDAEVELGITPDMIVEALGNAIDIEPEDPLGDPRHQLA